MDPIELQAIRDRIFRKDTDFRQLRQAIWEFQRDRNPVMRGYCEAAGISEESYIPIEFFKHFDLRSGWAGEAEAVFESSGTSGQTPSRHVIPDLSVCGESVLKGFFHFFPEKQYRILALLPSYLERGNSSLVWMVTHWIKTFGLPGSGFYLRNFDALEQAIVEASEAGEPVLLIGVAFALLDFAETHPVKLPPDAIVIETGGMKGRREEMVRAELHDKVRAGFGLAQISSEYGMTELSSQAYAISDGRFRTPPWMQVEISDIHLSSLPVDNGVTGRINIVDLANLHSCAFISTDDMGRMHSDGSFEVLGRVDYAEMRGCSLMYV